MDTDLDGALEVAERIRRGVRAIQADTPARTLTMSIGVAMFPDDATSKEELLDKADWAMYLAKRRGRDRVVAFAAGQRSDGADEAAAGGVPEDA